MTPRAAAVAIALSFVVPSAAWSSAGPATPTFQFSWPILSGNPLGIATDPQGNVYVLDSATQRVLKFDYLGTPITQWGSAGSVNGQFTSLYGIAIDASGNVYVVEAGGNRVQKFTATGGYVAGWGSTGGVPGGGPGQFNGPQGIAVDAAGNVYVADSGNQRIQKFTAGGAFITQWGSSGSGNGQFATPARIAVDPTGSVYVSDFGNNRIQKFTATGTYVAQWGTFGTGNGQFTGPAGITADAVGNLYVAEYFGCRVQKFDATGAYLGQWGSPGSGDGQFSTPMGISADAAGNLYVVESGNARVQKFSGAGASLPAPAPPAFLLTWGTPGSGNGQFTNPRSVAIDGTGNVYVADIGNHRIQKFTGGGAYLTQWGSNGIGNGQFSFPDGIAVDAANNVYVADYSNNRIQKFTAAGAYLTQWGSSGSGNGQLNGPEGITVDAVGNVYVTDALNNRVQKFTSAGAYLGQWGSSGSGNGQFNVPSDVASDATGNVYVVETAGNRVQKFTSAGAYLTQWGSAGSGPGQFAAPIGVSVDGAGAVYVAENSNHRVQKFTSIGGYLTQWGSLGTGNGQFNYVSDVAAAGGIVYVADFNSRVEKFVSPPAIALVSDVGNDQGRQVRLRILHSPADAAGSGATITGYAVYRRVDPLAGAADLTARSATPAGATLAGWDYVTTIPARGDAEYSVVVPTLADANASASSYTAFFVSALTVDPYVYFDSPAEYGYSVDNLPPLTPAPFTAAYAGGATHLHWPISSDADFSTFRLYRGASAAFIPAVGNRVASTADTGYADVGPAGSYYKLTAVDRNGNESSVALVTPAGTTDAPGADLPRMIELAAPFPNPMRAGGTFGFALPRTTRVSLGLYDVAGRRVRALVEGERPAGAGTVDWDGRDDEGRRLPAGLLVLRFAAGGRVVTRRVVTLE